jgi:outer membrane receptor protein involved in Fe transport
MHISRIRGRLLATTFFAGAVAAVPAFAQTTAVAPAAAAADADCKANPSGPDCGGEIVVTGSRIASPSLTSAAPLQIVTSKDIQSTGAAILQDVLQQNPVFGSPTLSRTNSNFLTSSGGVATVNLRDLGDARTLVLVDGHRFVSGVPNSPAVDLNSIPTGFIDRVEIVSGGESSIYGSDAVAGVVNIIYKTHFEGVEGNVQSGITQYGDGQNYQANLTFGTNFADDRGNIMVYGGYSKDGAIHSADRSRTATDQSSLGFDEGGVIDDIFKVDRPVRSSYIPVGTFFGDFGNIRGDGSPYPVPQADKFNRQSYRYIATPVERYTLALKASYEISSAANVFLDGTFTHSRVSTQIEPTPLASFDPNGVNHETGEISLGTRLADGTIFLNPLVPSYISAIAGDDNGDGIPDVEFTRRMTDVGDRSSTADRFTYEITTGVKGAISDKWNYEVFGSYGRTQDDQINGGAINLEHLRNALSVAPATPNAPGAIQAPNGAWIQCASVNAVAEGCVPANIFGANTLSPAAAAYVGTNTTRNAFAEQINGGASVDGQLGDYWGAGPIRVAAGVEYRKERSAVVYDSLTTQGGTSGNALPNTQGTFNVKEAFGEIHVPIITDKPLFHSLEARAAGRVSNYSSIGTVYSYNYGGIYSPIPDVTFRASVALATRAPNIGELFSGLSQTFPTGVTDPCTGVTAVSTGQYDTRCRADPSVAANIAQHGSFTLTQADQQGISGYDGGNPNLQQEKARTFTAGMVINPRSIHALRNFSLTVDYTRTHITGAIVTTDRQTELNDCYNGVNTVFCSLIQRRTANQGNASIGALTYVNAFATNSGGILEKAIDATAAYKQGIGSYGTLGFSLSYTHMMQGWTKALPGAAKNYFAGEVGSPKDKFLATLDWTKGPITVEYRGQYLGRSYLDDQFVYELVDSNGNPITNRHDPRARIGAYYIQDLQVSADVGDHFSVYAGVNNLLNISPPPIYSNLPGDTTGTETDAGDYDAIGRRFYAGVRLKF